MTTGNDDDGEDLGFIRHHYWLEDRSEDFVLQLNNSNEFWKLGPILKERVLHGDKHEDIMISEASGLCIATQIDGPRKGMKAIAKIRVQIPPGMNDPYFYNSDFDYSIYKSPITSIWAANEFFTLKLLTDRGCKCTPQYIGHEIRRQSKDSYVPGGYIVYTLMEKVPGTNLLEWPTFPLEKRNRVRLAFGKAIREFYSQGVEHNDPNRHNMIWDESVNRCWIIDLEDIEFVDPPRKFIPRSDWAQWGIIRPNYNFGPLDPMAPDGYDECPDDDALYALTTRTKTRDFCK